MPLVRISQAAPSFLFELGSGDIFFFDMGSGSMMRFAALGLSYACANKLFLNHLHVDHMCKAEGIPAYPRAPTPTASDVAPPHYSRR